LFFIIHLNGMQFVEVMAAMARVYEGAKLSMDRA
jgi:hypothetical protein